MPTFQATCLLTGPTSCITKPPRDTPSRPCGPSLVWINATGRPPGSSPPPRPVRKQDAVRSVCFTPGQGLGRVAPLAFQGDPFTRLPSSPALPPPCSSHGFMPSTPGSKSQSRPGQEKGTPAVTQPHCQPGRPRQAEPSLKGPEAGSRPGEALGALCPQAVCSPAAAGLCLRGA